MCLQNAAPDEEKPRKGKFFCWTHNVDIEPEEYAAHDRQGCDIQDMDWEDHK